MSNLDTAVAEAAQELIDKAKGQKEEVVEETPTSEETNENSEDSEGAETESETEDSEEEETEEDLKEDQLTEAKKLYKALLDPNQRVAIIAELAQRSGILREQPETKTEIKEAKKSIQDIIKEALPEFPGLSEKLGKAIDTALEQKLEEVREEHEEEMQTVHLNQLENQVSGAIARLRQKTDGASKQFESRMAELSNQLIMGPGLTIDQYVSNLYSVASAGRSSARIKAQTADKIRRNANNAPDRLKNSTGPGSPGKFDNVPSKKMNLNESVNWAISEAFKGRSKA